MSDMSLRFNDAPVCPFCGHEEDDSWELPLESDSDKTEIECGNCEEEYGVMINVSVTYDTYKLDGEVDE